MMIYNFIFCFVNNLRIEQSSPFGRFAGSLYVALTILLHSFFFYRIGKFFVSYDCLLHYRLPFFIHPKFILFFLVIVIWRGCWLYFNFEKINVLMRKYQQLYIIESTKTKNRFRRTLVLHLISSIVLAIL